MICEVCKKNKAVVHFINIVNGKRKQQMLCEECALKISLPSENEENKDEVSFNKILSGIFDYMDNYKKADDEIIICKNCGRTYDEFKEAGICGCSKCYEYFSEKFDFLEEKEHVGKIPKVENSIISNKIKLNKLNKQLEFLIINEEYEKAALIRDEIKRIKGIVNIKEGGNE